MDDEELKRFLVEELPRIRQAYPLPDPRLHWESFGPSPRLYQLQDALTALLALLRDVAEATDPFIHLQDKGDYALGIITMAQVDRLMEIQARLRALLPEGR